MLNTYINDNSMSPYPFSSAETLPFPMSCIAGMGVCLHHNTALAGVVATSVELSAVGCTVTLATDDGVYLTSVSAAAGEMSTVVAFTAGDLTGSVYLACGIIPPAAYGTYVGSWKLDPSCVYIVDDAYMGADSSIVINDIPHKTDDILRLNYTGYFKLTTTASSSAVSLMIAANVPNTARTTVARIGENYTQVTNISGADVREHYRQDYSGALRIVLGEGIKCTLQNARYASTIVPDYEADRSPGPRETYGYSYNDKQADTVILTLYGDNTIPNCYAADKDEADNPEDIT